MPVNTLGALPHECFLPVLPGLEGIGPGYIFPGRWQPPLLLRDQIFISHGKEVGLQMSVPQEPSPMLQTGQSHCP